MPRPIVKYLMANKILTFLLVLNNETIEFRMAYLISTITLKKVLKLIFYSKSNVLTKHLKSLNYSSNAVH